MPSLSLSFALIVIHAVSLSLLAVAQAARLSLSLPAVAQAVGYVLSYAIAHDVARTHTRVLDLKCRECSKQTQVGKPRRTKSPRFNPDEDGKRRANLMRRVHQVRTKIQRIEVSFDAKGQPLGKEGDELQSWIGVLAREHIPIWISDFRSADLAPRKEIVWMEVVTSFTIEESFKKQVLKSCWESAKGFRYDLYKAFVRDHIDEENVWQRPSKVVHNYPTITQDDWEKFIEYRRTPEFKSLSEQGSEIRKKSKYGSTGGRDGYRKRNQAHFEKTGKYADRHERWLDMRVKPDEEFKKVAFKTITETIDDFSQQETRGSFKSVGTEDILTKALGNAEHSVSDMKRQLAALERTVQELCAKHGINQETMAEETNAPTVYQHNSFKTSCTITEKEAGPSDPKPMPNASKECQLFIPDLVNGGDVLAAIGRAYMDCVPTDTVHGIPLGEENVRVTITVPKLNRALLPIPTNEATSIEEVVSGFVAWPKILVIVQTSLSQASKGPSRAPDREAEGSKRMDQRFEFISPVLVSPVQQNVDRATYVRERADYIVRILRKALKGKRFMMPYNSGQHWILAVIDPWDDSVMYFNPLENEPGDDFKDLITTALNDWKVLVGSGMRQRRNWQTLIDTVRCPIQEGYVECGYFVLAYMREITFIVVGLAVLQTKDFYTDADMSLVRQEWATFVMRATTTVSPGDRRGIQGVVAKATTTVSWQDRRGSPGNHDGLLVRP
ncbi:hypothetical protein TIFTF001_011962 [Ficus carica]|uniref:Ubiquitin-like protease family profile domain-containing protein n=1 Tax=Ficus carica TaxID=3494 RepID=A0AA87ZSN8_FICCA|nr:hypothetical protein TIFTF001_011962 [Ficus carica]